MSWCPRQRNADSVTWALKAFLKEPLADAQSTLTVVKCEIDTFSRGLPTIFLLRKAV